MSRLVPGLRSRNRIHGGARCRSRLPGILIIPVLLSAPGWLNGCKTDSNDFFEVSSHKATLQILEDAEFAITERNFRINNRLRIGKAIRERGVSGFPDNEVILFCNLSYAEKMLELAPEFLRYCPQRLSVRDNGDTRIISASLYPEKTGNPALDRVTREINLQVRDIVSFAAREWPPLESSVTGD